MSVTINTTPKDPNANSYADLSFATTYVNTRPYMTAWANFSTDQQSQALIWATALLDSCMDWNGVRRTITQYLKWPRAGVRTEVDGPWYDYDSIPKILSEATVELGLLLLQRDRTIEPDTVGLGLSGAVKLGSMSAELNPGAVLEFIPDYLLTKLKFLGSCWDVRRSRGSAVVKMIRA